MRFYANNVGCCARRGALAIVLLFPALFLLFFVRSAVAQETPSEPGALRIAIAELETGRGISKGVAAKLARSLEAGIRAAEAEPLRSAKVAVAVSEQVGRCDDAGCWRRIAEVAHCRYLLFARVNGRGSRSYQLSTWLVDSDQGAIQSRAETECVICGLKALASKLELAASAAVAKLREQQQTPAEVAVTTVPVGAQVSVNGQVVGTTPNQLRLAPGEHHLQFSYPGHFASERRVKAYPGVRQELEVRLLPVGNPGRLARIIGWSGVGVGAAALIAGVVLLTLDGKPTGCTSGFSSDLPLVECPQRRSSKAAGWSLTGLGLVGTLTGGYMLWRGYGAERRLATEGDETSAPVTLRDGGLSIAFD